MFEYILLLVKSICLGWQHVHANFLNNNINLTKLSLYYLHICFCAFYTDNDVSDALVTKLQIFILHLYHSDDPDFKTFNFLHLDHLDASFDYFFH
jgi:hypothetical protein